MNGWIAEGSYFIIHRHGPLAQWLEQATHNRLVAGSSPAGATRYSKGWREISGPFAFLGGPMGVPSIGMARYKSLGRFGDAIEPKRKKAANAA